ncbi:MAG: SMI1/KNR4 family protein [Opitutaceae bacterium]
MNFHDKPAPSTPEQISTWEKEFDITMPDDLRELLLESDGPIFYEEKTGKEIQFLSVLNSIEYYEAYQFPEFCKEAIPVALDGCGNFVVYKKENGTVDTLRGMSSTNLGWHDSVHLAEGINQLIEMEPLIEEVIFGD